MVRGISLAIFILIGTLWLNAWGAAQLEGEMGQDQTSEARPDVSKTFFKTVEFGLGAGLLVGMADISDFHHDIGAHLDTQNIFRGLSYGLYGGILLGLYLAYVVPGNSQDSSHEDESPEQPGLTNTLLYHRNFLIDPFVTLNGSAGIELKWSL